MLPLDAGYVIPQVIVPFLDFAMIHSNYFYPYCMGQQSQFINCQDIFSSNLHNDFSLFPSILTVRYAIAQLLNFQAIKVRGRCA